MFKHILIPTDGSELARTAITAGVAFAKALGARITAYHAIEGPGTRIYGDEALIKPMAMKEFEARLWEQAERYLADAQKAADAAGIACETLITTPAAPYRGIIDAAKEKNCDAIFMASHGRGNLASLVLGSVTHKVLAHSKIPVVVYR
jgi:nucleotide-binding universal stress UspA family protein